MSVSFSRPMVGAGLVEDAPGACAEALGLPTVNRRDAELGRQTREPEARALTRLPLRCIHGLKMWERGFPNGWVPLSRATRHFSLAGSRYLQAGRKN